MWNNNRRLTRAWKSKTFSKWSHQITWDIQIEILLKNFWCHKKSNAETISQINLFKFKICFQKHTKLFGIIIVVVLLQSIFIKYMHRLSYKANVRSPIQSEKCFVLKTFVTLLRSLIGTNTVSSESINLIQFIQTETSTPILPDHKVIQWVYGIWFASCLIISCFFTTTLTSFFARPGHAEQLKSISDIIRSKIPLSIDNMYGNMKCLLNRLELLLFALGTTRF